MGPASNRDLSHAHPDTSPEHCPRLARPRRVNSDDAELLRHPQINCPSSISRRSTQSLALPLGPDIGSSARDCTLPVVRYVVRIAGKILIAAAFVVVRWWRYAIDEQLGYCETPRETCVNRVGASWYADGRFKRGKRSTPRVFKKIAPEPSGINQEKSGWLPYRTGAGFLKTPGI
jgi:hypothetical protein